MGKEEIMFAGDPTQGLMATLACLWAHGEKARVSGTKVLSGLSKNVISVIGLL